MLVECSCIPVLETKATLLLLAIVLGMNLRSPMNIFDQSEKENLYETLMPVLLHFWN